MSRFVRFARSTGVLAVALALGGCVSSFAPPRRCAPVALVNGQHMLLDRTDYLNVEIKLSAYLADRGMILVSDVASADMLVTIAYEPDPAAPGKVIVLVLDVVQNHLSPTRRPQESRMDRDYSSARPAARSFPTVAGSSAGTPWLLSQQSAVNQAGGVHIPAAIVALIGTGLTARKADPKDSQVGFVIPCSQAGPNEE